MALTHLTFRKEFAEAMKAYLVAQQGVKRGRFGEEKTEQQQKAVIISAEDDARVANLLANSLATTGDGLIELRKLLRTWLPSSPLLEHHLPANRASQRSSSFPSEAS